MKYLDKIQMDCYEITQKVNLDKEQIRFLTNSGPLNHICDTLITLSSPVTSRIQLNKVPGEHINEFTIVPSLPVHLTPSSTLPQTV